MTGWSTFTVRHAPTAATLTLTTRSRLGVFVDCLAGRLTHPGNSAARVVPIHLQLGLAELTCLDLQGNVSITGVSGLLAGVVRVANNSRVRAPVC